LIKSALADEKHLLAGYRIVKDEPTEIEALLSEALANEQVEAVIVNGGTGISPAMELMRSLWDYSRKGSTGLARSFVI